MNPAAGSLHSARGEELVRLIHETPPPELLPILDNPSLDEKSLVLLLQRKDLPAEFLQEVLLRRQFLKSYQVKKALALHPHTPRTDGFRLLRELYLMDLVQFAISPGTLPDLKIKAEEQVINKLPHLPLGQKITLARRGPARLGGALLTDGHANIVPIVLDNPHLTEAQVLKALSREKLPPGVVQALAHHRKWSLCYNVRLALVRNPASPLSVVLGFLPELTVSDLRELASPGIVPESLRKYLQAEVQHRIRPREKSSSRNATTLPPDASN